MSADKLGDIISTASLLLAIVTALMGFWYADVARAIDTKEPRLPAEREVAAKASASVFWGKAFPLAIGAVAIALIFIKRALTVLCASLALVGEAWCYDDMLAAFVVTEALMLALACVTVRLAWRLGAKYRRLQGEASANG